MLTNVMFEEAAPAVCGANATWNETLPPEAIVTGREMPLTVN